MTMPPPDTARGSDPAAAQPAQQQTPALLHADVRPDLHRPHATMTRYATDQSDTITYRLNSAGFRGEDLDPQTSFRLCVIGESHAFGVGVEQSQTFGHQLKTHIATALELPPDKVNYINLALAGQSADYCVRTAYRQLRGLGVDLLVGFMPFPDRIEYYWPKLGYRSLDAASLTEENLVNAPVPLLGFTDLYTDQMGHLWLLKNMLCLQDFCRRHQIDYVLANQHTPANQRRKSPLAAFDDMLDDTAILESQLFDLRPDRAVDRTHGGPRTHAAFAIALLDRFARVLARKGDRPRARKLADHAKALKTSDPNWIYCQADMAQQRQKAAQAGSPLNRSSEP